MATSEARIAMNDSPADVFQTGKYQLWSDTVRTSHSTKPPVELFIVAPTTKGTYPVLLFCHGFNLANDSYSSLLHHIASHGYILVAPQFYGPDIIPIFEIDIPEEVRRAEKVTQWVSTGLPVVLPANVERDMENLALSGHSRGGKTAFALALEMEKKSHEKEVMDNTPPTLPYKFKAVIGIDPVAGFSPSSQPSPQILKWIPRCFDMSIPVAVIGTGIGSQSNWFIPPFAPHGVNHSEFFNESKPPACYFLCKDYGHVDMMDDEAIKSWKVCKSGEGSKEDMRRSVGGIVVAFLKHYLGGDEKDLNAIVDDPKIAPIVLKPVIHVKE